MIGKRKLFQYIDMKKENTYNIHEITIFFTSQYIKI